MTPDTPRNRKADHTSASRRGHTFTVVVPNSVRDFFLTTQVMGQGGFQSLCRMLSERLRTTPVLHLDEAEFRRIVRYANHYGEGGFQVKLRRLISEWTEQNMARLTKGDDE